MKFALISGAESGLAKASIAELEKLDYTIFCCDIQYKEIKVENNKHFIPLDVTSDESLKKAYNYISGSFDTKTSDAKDNNKAQAKKTNTPPVSVVRPDGKTVGKVGDEVVISQKTKTQDSTKRSWRIKILVRTFI